MILTGPEIQVQLARGTIEIERTWVKAGGVVESEPIDPKNIWPNSVDITLGTTVKVYSEFVYVGGLSSGESLEKVRENYDSWSLSSMLWADVPRDLGNRGHYAALDSKKPHETDDYEMDDSGWVVKPGILYLMHTVERIHSMEYVPYIDGKSSMGRLGVSVHITAGRGDTGYDGQYTLEVTAIHPVRLYPGMDIAQVTFHCRDGKPKDYRERGHYVGKAALEAEPSHAWQQFQEK